MFLGYFEFYLLYIILIFMHNMSLHRLLDQLFFHDKVDYSKLAGLPEIIKHSYELYRKKMFNIAIIW